MSIIEHTPGPWRASHWLDDDEGCLITSGSKTVALALHAGGVQQSEVNARIIAAAPGLLAALKELKEYFQSYDYDEAWEAEGADSPPVIIDAAIAKAESGLV